MISLYDQCDASVRCCHVSVVVNVVNAPLPLNYLSCFISDSFQVSHFTMAQTRIAIKIQHEYLVAGYLRRIAYDVDKMYPLDLLNIFFEFTGNFLLRFDTTNPDFSRCIAFLGTIFDRNYEYPKRGVVNVGSSIGITEGIVSFRVKYSDAPKNDAIGIMSEFTQDDRGLLCQRGFQYYAWGDHMHNRMPGRISFISSYGPEGIVREKIVKTTWAVGDVFTVKVDCNDWTVRFYINDKSLRWQGIEPHKVYYPFLCSQNEQGRYEIV